MRRLGLSAALAVTLAANSGLVVSGQVLDGATLPSLPTTSSQEPALLETLQDGSQNTFHNGWASISNGKLLGRATSITDSGDIQGIAGARVALLKNAAVISTALADPDGNFVIGEVTPGIYGITIETENGFAAHSFNAVSDAQANGPMNVYVSKLPRRVVDELLQSLWTPDMAPGSAKPFMDLAPRGNAMMQSPKVQMVNGVVYGEVIFENPMAIPANHFVKVFNSAGALLATERVDAYGRFSFSPPSPGLYNIVVGGGAYACVAVHVIAGNEAAALPQSTAIRFVSTKNEAVPAVPTTLVISAIGPPPPSPVVAQDDFDGGFVGPGGAPAYPAGGGFSGGGGGGFGGGGAGGGFGGGGIGGLGGLLGIAGLAVGVAALADDDDGFTPPPPTPIAP